jgi:hypothetical protein
MASGMKRCNPAIWLSSNLLGVPRAARRAGKIRNNTFHFGYLVLFDPVFHRRQSVEFGGRSVTDYRHTYGIPGRVIDSKAVIVITK